MHPGRVCPSLGLGFRVRTWEALQEESPPDGAVVQGCVAALGPFLPRGPWDTGPGEERPAHLRLCSASSHWPWPKGPLSSICSERPVLQTVASVGAWCPRVSVPWVLEE